MPAGDVFEVSNLMTQDDDKVMNRWHVLDPTGVSFPETAISAAVIANIIPSYQACCSNNLHFVELIVRRVYPTKGGAWLFGVGLGGSFAYEPLPPQSCVILSMRSNTVSIMGRGRVCVPGIPQSEVQDGVILNGYQVLLETLATKLSTAFGGFNIGNWNSLGGPFHPWTQFHIPTYIHTLRSRRFA